MQGILHSRWHVEAGVDFDLPGPLGAAGFADQARQGARQDAARFSTAQGCAVEKPRETRGPGA